jgi:RNA polymerase sigma-70 factor, ECF subfamily
MAGVVDGRVEKVVPGFHVSAGVPSKRMEVSGVPQQKPAQPSPRGPSGIERWIPEALKLARRLTGSTHDAEDLVQTALLKAARGFHLFRGEASIRTWLYRILINCHRDRSRVPAAVALPESLVARATGEDGDLEAAIELALRELPDRQREAVLLHKAGLTTEQSAAAMSTSATNVRKLLQLGRDKLRERLAPYLEGRP